MLVFFALGNAKVLSFPLGNAKLLDASSFASQWNIGFSSKPTSSVYSIFAVIHIILTFPSAHLPASVHHGAASPGSGGPGTADDRRRGDHELQPRDVAQQPTRTLLPTLNRITRFTLCLRKFMKAYVYLTPHHQMSHKSQILKL